MDGILYFMTAFPFELPSAQLDYGKRFSVSRSASDLPWRLSCCLADQVASTAARPHRRWRGRSVTVRRGDTFSGLPHVSTSPGSAVRMPVRLLKPHLCRRGLYLLSTQIAPPPRSGKPERGRFLHSEATKANMMGANGGLFDGQPAFQK